MLTERRQRADTKATRRKINQKMQTIIRKSVELAQNSCEVLLIIQNSANKQWIQYSSSEASSLFFGFENAKKHLQEVEEYNNSNVHKFVNDITVDQDSYSPKPVKHLKTIENCSSLPQSLNAKTEKIPVILQSEISTDQTSLKSLDRFMGKVVLPPDKIDKLTLKTQDLDENSSPDFLFEDYFNETLISRFLQSLNMKALDSITTSQWSNIPPCVVQSINVLVEQLRNQGLQSESLKSQFFDLSAKFSAKTQKLESSLEELHEIQQINKNTTQEKIRDLDQTTKNLNEAVDKVTRNAGGHFNELKARINHMVNEFKKTTKEYDRRAELINEQVMETIHVKTEKSKVEIEESLKEFINKYVIFARDIEDVVGKIKDKQEDFQKTIHIIQEKMISQTVCLELNEKTMKSANDILSKLVFRNQKNKTSIKDLSRKVDDFVNRPATPVSSCKSEPCFQTDELGPLNDKIEKLIKKIEEVEGEFNKSLQDLDFLTQKNMKKVENGLKLWTKDEISKDIDLYMGDAKKKLDWIPNGSESMKGMTVTEARLFLLESRIRQEENSRILSVQQLEQELKSLNRPRSVSSHKKSKTSSTPIDEKVISFQKVKMVSKRPSSSLGYREIPILTNTGLRDKFRLKVNDLTL